MSCPFFRVQVKTLQQPAEPDADGSERVRIAEIPWCGHPKHAVVDLDTAQTVIGGPPLLKCRGEISRCPLPPAQYADVQGA